MDCVSFSKSLEFHTLFRIVLVPAYSMSQIIYALLLMRQTLWNMTRILYMCIHSSTDVNLHRSRFRYHIRYCIR